MNRSKFSFWAILILLTISFVACVNANSKKDEVTTLPPADFKKKLTNEPGAQLVDVRTPEEYNSGHLANAMNIDLRNDDHKKQFSSLDRNKAVFVYCLAGSRSSAAADELADMGFKRIFDLQGGILKWTNAGLPLANANAADDGLKPEDFYKMVSRPGYVLVDYNAKWCEPCRKMMPDVEQLCAERMDRLSLVKIDADSNKALLLHNNISGIPYLELYSNGKVVWKHEGYISNDDIIKEAGL
jgi:thioredoxin 1